MVEQLKLFIDVVNHIYNTKYVAMLELNPIPNAFNPGLKEWCLKVLENGEELKVYHNASYTIPEAKIKEELIKELIKDILSNGKY